MIEIVDYDPAWPGIFEWECAAIEGVLGPMVERVEHTGSTAVPGLAAKPIVDLLLGLDREYEMNACVEPLRSIGYEYVAAYETRFPDRRYFRKRRPAAPYPHNLHVVRVGSDFWLEHLAFRDHLRTHPEAAAAYAAHKRALAPRFTDTNQYADAKTDFVRSMLAEALR